MNGVALPDTERRREAPGQSAGQLVWLTLATVIAGLPHYVHMAPWIPPLALGIAGWRIHAAVTRRGLPGTWLRIPLTLLVFAAVVVTYRQVSGLDAGSALLLVMVSLKLLETRGSRDRAVVVFMCYFLLFAAFLRDQPLWSGLWLIAGVLVTTASLLQIARENSVIAPREALAEAGSLMLQAAPLMLLLFLLFPLSLIHI